MCFFCLQDLPSLQVIRPRYFLHPRLVAGPLPHSSLLLLSGPAYGMMRRICDGSALLHIRVCGDCATAFVTDGDVPYLHGVVGRGVDTVLV
jgi:hypothetical protein